MNAIYRIQQNPNIFTPPPDNKVLPDRRRAKVDEESKLSFKSYFYPTPPSGESRDSVVDILTETILVKLFNYQGENDLRRKLKEETKKFEQLERNLANELKRENKLSQIA